MSVKGMKTYMRFVAAKIRVKLAAEVGEHFGLMFDGWLNNSIHFLCLGSLSMLNGEWLLAFCRWTRA